MSPITNRKRIWPIGIITKCWWVSLEVLLIVIGIIVDSLIGYKSDNLSGVTLCVFEMLPVFAGFAMTIYLLFIEVYKDRYSYAFVKGKALPKIRKNLVGIILSILFGLFVFALADRLVLEIAFMAISSFACVMVIIDLFGTSRTLTVEAYVEDYCSELTARLEKKENAVGKKSLRVLAELFEECILKEEFFAAQKIVNRMGEIFRTLLTNSISMLSSGETEESIEESFKSIISFGANQLSNCDDIHSELLIKRIINQQCENISLCISTNQKKWFEAYVSCLTTLYQYKIRLDNEKTPGIILEILIDVFEKLLQRNNTEWSKYLTESLKGVSSIALHVGNNKYMSLYARFLVFGLTHNTDENFDQFLFGLLRDYTLFVTQHFNTSREFNRVYYGYYYELKKEKNIKKMNRFLKLIFNEIEDVDTDLVWDSFKITCVDTLSRDDYYEKIIRPYLMQLLQQIIDNKVVSKNIVLLPNFNREIYGGDSTKEKVESACHDAMRLMIKAIRADNRQFLDYLLLEWNDCLEESTLEQEEIQKALFDVYFGALYYSYKSKNKMFVEIIFDEIEQVVMKMDNKKTISPAFGEYVIDEIAEVAYIVDSESEGVLQGAIELLQKFSSPGVQCRFVANVDKRKSLGKALYSIAISCIENDYEKSLRAASNALGWLIIDSIESGYVDAIKYLINLTSHSYYLAGNMMISKKTMTFMTTLFTTVGMYCFVSPDYECFLKYILGEMKNFDQEMVETAIELRTYENDTFKDLFGNREMIETCKKKLLEQMQRAF